VKRLVLVGGGHAHLHVLERLARHPLPGTAVTLVAPGPSHHYSGMVPGYLQGTYAEADLAIDLRPLCRAAGAAFVEGHADRVDPRAGTVTVAGTDYPFDACSLDVGAEAAGLDVPGAREHALSLRPMARAVVLRRRIDEAIRAAGGGPVRAVVAGGGPGGVEVALALHRRVADRGATPGVHLVEAGPHLLSEFAPRVRRRVTAILVRRGVRPATGQPVARVEPAAVALASGERIAADLTVWVTGAAPPAVVAASPLPRDERGFFLVDPTLRAADGAPVWGAGDCVGLAGHPAMPKAGVYAVRAAPVLAANLRAALAGGPTARYAPQASFLALLNTADGRALLRWRRLVAHARWAWWLKDRIDRGFVERYRTAAPGGPRER
jgi:selenide,water dikinase